MTKKGQRNAPDRIASSGQRCKWGWRFEIGTAIAEIKIIEAFLAGHAHAMEKVRGLVETLEWYEAHCAYGSIARAALAEFKGET